ncbi:BrnA antitoxin family protein [Afifella sp. H1R]|uniref:BrnA antitoxin family protein n=1 Tax=Afifella sp. H1R TaxID=2908841 RepID=UPI001F23B73F|nr:BrnA antitoxin family protein [Afifella sp. H1R]MCF1503242.1 BrnA antitoxin family protein [Afifella sp. H1R]
MTKRNEKKRTFEPGRGYSRDDWEEVSDNPELTEGDFREARPFREAFPDLAAKMERNVGGRPKKTNPKQAVSLRLDAEVIEKFKATGPGWQTRINDVLKAAKL